MRIIVASIVAALLLAAGAGLVLSRTQRPTYQARAMPTVRIDDPGENLVGRDWSGLNGSAQKATKVSQANTDRR
jgi:uncharacterized protein involved in exopolysaccharide biosynthesis